MFGLPQKKDCTNPECRVLDLHGSDCGRENIPSNPCHSQSGLHAGDESQLDYVSAGARVRPEIPARANVGSFFQYCGVRDWHIHQCAHEEKEVGCIAEEGMWSPQRRSESPVLTTTPSIMVKGEATREGLKIIQSVIIECYWSENDNSPINGWGYLCVHLGKVPR